MSQLRSFRPSLQRLDDRITPAVTATYYAGSLTLKGVPTGIIAVTGVGGAGSPLFAVTDNGAPIGSGTYGLSGNLTMQFTSRPNAINIDLNGGFIGGNVMLSLGNGSTAAPAVNDPIDIYDSLAVAALGTGEIRGGLSITNGNGNERIDLGGQWNGVAFTDLPVTVRGNVSIATRANANLIDTLVMGDGSMVRGSFTAANVDDVSLGRPAIAAIANVPTVLGDVSITTSGAGPGLTVDLVGRFDRSVTVNAAATTANFNTFTLEPVDPFVNSTVGGALNVTLRQTSLANRFRILGTATETSVVTGATNLTSATGVTATSMRDSFTLQGSFLNSLTVSMGEGDNNINYDVLASVAGNMTVNGGNGTNYFATEANVATTFAGSVAQNLNFNFGSGNNNGGAAMQVGGAVGLTLRWRSGNGANYLRVGDGSGLSYLVDVIFGSGDDTFEYNLGAGALTGTVDGGGRITANLLIPTSGAAGATTFVNFP